LSIVDINGLPPHATTIEHIYDMFTQILECTDKNIDILITVKEEVDFLPCTDDENTTVSTEKKNDKLYCSFTHKLYGFKITFTLDKIKEGVIIYDIKSEKRIRQLEEQINGVVWMTHCNKPIQLDCNSLKLVYISKLEKLLNHDDYTKMLRIDFLKENGIGDSAIKCISGGGCMSYIINSAALMSININDDEHKFTGHNIRPISLLSNLTSLVISDNPHLVNIKPIGDLALLIDLVITNCIKLSDISIIGNLKELRRLNLSGCKNMVDVSFLVECVKLIDLNLTETSVRNVLTLKNLHNLIIVGI
jgi:hypothetical protein